jgi:protein-tyrosine phosphatase
MSDFEDLSKPMLRQIAAPFQDTLVDSIENLEKEELSEFDKEFESIKYSFGSIDVHGTFVESEYYGPTPESNWVVKGKLIAGAFPGFTEDDKNVESLTQILNSGVSLFACLQKEYDNEIPEEFWKKNKGLRPYFKDVEKMIANKEEYTNLETNIEKAIFIHEKIRDCDIADDDTTIKLAKKLVKAIYDGEVVYLHCWGGHGRTGVIVCIMLHLMYKLTSHESLLLCQKLHNMRLFDLGVSSPQTFQQRIQVIRIITKLGLQ